jgi:Glycosyl hydrolase family 3 C-terminal domain
VDRRGSDDEEPDRAVALAGEAGAAVVVVGTTEEVESEGFDRDALALPGQEFGDALADVLLGAVEPGGRLPVTWPADEHRLIPSTRPVDGTLAYDESLHIGHCAYERADEVTVGTAVPARAFADWDSGSHRWRTEPGPSAWPSAGPPTTCPSP